MHVQFPTIKIQFPNAQTFGFWYNWLQFSNKRFWTSTKLSKSPTCVYIQTFGFWSNWLQISYNGSSGFRQNARPIYYNYDPISQCVNFRILVQLTPIFEQWKLSISTTRKSIFHNSHVLFSKLQSILLQNRNFNFPNNTRLGFLMSLTIFLK